MPPHEWCQPEHGQSIRSVERSRMSGHPEAVPFSWLLLARVARLPLARHPRCEDQCTDGHPDRLHTVTPLSSQVAHSRYPGSVMQRAQHREGWNIVAARGTTERLTETITTGVAMPVRACHHIRQRSHARGICLSNSHQRYSQTTEWIAGRRGWLEARSPQGSRPELSRMNGTRAAPAV
jgi:hypothetical protein